MKPSSTQEDFRLESHTSWLVCTGLEHWCDYLQARSQSVEPGLSDISGATERIKKSDLRPAQARSIETDASAQDCISTPDRQLCDDGSERNQEAGLALKENLQTLFNQPPNYGIPNAAGLVAIHQASVHCPDPGRAH